MIESIAFIKQYTQLKDKEYLRCLHLLRVLDDHSLKTVIPLAWKFNIIWNEKPRTCLLPMVPKCKIQSINRTVKQSTYILPIFAHSNINNRSKLLNKWKQQVLHKSGTCSLAFSWFNTHTKNIFKTTCRPKWPHSISSAVLPYT